MIDDSLHSAILDSVDSQIAVIDRRGVILYCNQAWRDFAAMNGLPPDHPWIGTSYLGVCDASSSQGDRDGAAVASGIHDMLSGRSTCFSYEYPCHSPTEQRWFMMHMASLHGFPDCYVVSHHNITERKLSEQRVAEANSELTRLSTTDKLTRLANRARLDQAIEQEIYRASRYGSELAAIMLDLDHFKSVNDRHGHLAGDQVLIEVASVLHAGARESDVVGRWGGEEFLILLPASGLAAAGAMAEKLRGAIASHDFSPLEQQTCSFGVTLYQAGDSAAKLVERVDRALYEAKHNGRNRVEVAVP